MRKTVVCLAIAAALSGCAGTGNFIVPPNKASAWSGEDLTCVSVMHIPETQINAKGVSGAVLAVIARGMSSAYDAMLAVGDAEAGKYSASYSGKTTTAVYRKVANSYLPPESISFVRLLPEDDGKTDLDCDARNGEVALSMSFKFESKVNSIAKPKVTDGKSVDAKADGFKAIDGPSDVVMFRLVPESIIVTKVKAKVPAMSWWRPWTWVLFMERDYARVDLNAKAGLSAGIVGEDGKLTKADIVQIDFPLGKIAIGDGPYTFKEAKLKSLSSEWFQLPAHPSLPVESCDAATAEKCERPLNVGALAVTVTVEEANDLGDVLKKEMERARGKQQERIDDLVKEIKDKL